MKLNSIIQLLFALALFGISSLASASGDCFNDEPWLFDEMGIPENDAGEPLHTGNALKRELLVESERLKQSGARYLEINRDLKGYSLPQGSKEYYQVLEITDNEDCAGIQFLKPLDPAEVNLLKFKKAGTANPMATMMDMYGAAMSLAGEAGSRAIGDTGDYPGIILDFTSACPDRLRGSPDQPLYADTPLVLLAGPACFARAAADFLRSSPKNINTQIVRSLADALKEAARLLKDEGVENVSGKPSQKLAANNLDIQQQGPNGEQVTINNMAVWIDVESWARTKIRFEGRMKSGGENRGFFLERELGNFQLVPGTVLLHPYLETLRMGGMLGPKERAELAEAQKKMKEFEAQLAAMPESQRAMMERMMGPQLEQMRSLTSSGNVEFQFVTTSVVVNPEKGADASVLPVDGSAALISLIQNGLVKLGMYSGPENGELTPETATAIREYESSKGMQVTGKATQPVAKAIGEDVYALGK